MSRPPREDGPDTWHHVMNRGLAHRTIFENDSDVRFFESRLALAVRDEAIEVHAFSMLPTHFHLLIRSVRGELSRSMMWVENQFVRWFNRRRGRDGPLFRGRFWSSRITSMTYWRVLVRYIENNAVAARLVAQSDQYPHCSGYYYSKPSGPIWLTRTTIEDEVRAACGSSNYLPKDYLTVFGNSGSPEQAWLVARRMERPASGKDPLDYLMNSPTPAVKRWMIRMAALADGRWREHVTASPENVETAVSRFKEGAPEWKVRANGWETSGWKVLAAGSLRSLSGLKHQEIGRRMQVSQGAVGRLLREHRDLMLANADYSHRASLILQETLKAF